MVMPSPAAVLSRLKAMLAASTFGMTSRLASPLSATGWNRRAWRALGFEAPRRRASRRRLRARGACSAMSASASRIFTRRRLVVGAESCECDSSATLGAMPKRRTSSAASSVISASCSALGIVVDVGVADEHLRSAASACSCAANVFTPRAGRSPGRCSAGARACVPKVPHSMPSASPACSSIAPISVRRRRISILANCAVTPLRCGQLVVGLPVVAVALVLLGVDDVEVRARLRGAGRTSRCAAAITAGAADQDRPRKAFVDDDLHRAQHALVLAFGVGHALVARLLGRGRRSASSSGPSGRRSVCSFSR